MPTSGRARTDLPGTLGADHADGSEHRPLLGYSVLTTTFLTGFAGALYAGRDRGFPRLSTRDIVLAGIATHKLSRLIAKDKVGAFARAPFTRLQGFAGHGEVDEAARGRGLRGAVGELLVCPYCLGQWISGGFIAGFVHWPHLTRLLASLWTVYAISDGLQLAYKAAEDRA